MYALVDCNNFYVSCERIFDPSLHGRPVAILSNNDGCIISRSEELKELRIDMGLPYFRLKETFRRHDIQVRSSNYELYGDISRRVMAVLGDFSPELEPYSIDEAFLKLPRPAGSDFEACGHEMHKRVLKWVGVPVSVGIAPTKTLAKIAAHIAKKGKRGAYCLPDDLSAVLPHIPLEEVWGVGRRLAKKLRAHGICNAADFAARDFIALREKFGICVARTAMELNGTPALEPEDLEGKSHSITCTRSFGKRVSDFAELREAVANYTAWAAVKMRGENQRAAGVNIFFELCPEEGSAGFSGGSVSTTVMLSQPLSGTAEILAEIFPALERIYRKGKFYRRAGVLFFGLSGAAADQLDLFTGPVPEHNDKLYSAVDRLNARLGKDKVFLLCQGIERPWQMKRNLLSGRCTTRWRELMKVN